MIPVNTQDAFIVRIAVGVLISNPAMLIKIQRKEVKVM